MVYIKVLSWVWFNYIAMPIMVLLDIIFRKSWQLLSQLEAERFVAVGGTFVQEHFRVVVICAARAAGRGYAVLHGISRNNDGRSTSTITKPSAEQQLKCMKKVWDDVTECMAVECHGTGTPTGDPIEIQSVGRMFGQPNGPGIALGAIKSNINHTESAAGLAGLIKAVHVLQMPGMFPHGAGLWSPDKSIDLEAGGKGLNLSTEFQPLHGIRGIGVNSFGFSGTNVHAALLPPTEDGTPQNLPRPLLSTKVILLSSHSSESLRQSMATLAHESKSFCSADLSQVAAQSLSRDTRHCRKAVLAQTADELSASLSKEEDGVWANKRPKLVLVIPGNGCQSAGMLKENLGKLRIC